MTIDAFFAEHPEWRPYADLVVVPPTAEEIREEFPDADADVLARCQSGGQVSVGTLYVRMRREGQDDRWAAMLALQQFPGIQTTDTFWAGNKPWHEVYGEKYANEVKAILARRGVNLRPGDTYYPQLAKSKGDPEAVIPFDGARSYIRKLCEKRGWACEGAVNLEARQPDSDPHEQAVPLAEDLVRSNAKRMVEKNPDLARLSRRELRQRVLAQHGAQK